MRLEDLTPGISLVGLEPSAVATIVALMPIAAGAVTVIYKTPDGTLKERLLGRADEATIAIATQERPWAFDGNGEDFKFNQSMAAHQLCLFHEDTVGAGGRTRIELTASGVSTSPANIIRAIPLHAAKSPCPTLTARFEGWTNAW